MFGHCVVRLVFEIPLHPWFSTFLTLRKIILLILHDYNIATGIYRNVKCPACRRSQLLLPFSHVWGCVRPQVSWSRGILNGPFSQDSQRAVLTVLPGWDFQSYLLAAYQAPTGPRESPSETALISPGLEGEGLMGSFMF